MHILYIHVYKQHNNNYYNEAYIHVLYLPTLSKPLLESDLLDFGLRYFTSYKQIKKNSSLYFQVHNFYFAPADTLRMTFIFCLCCFFSYKRSHKKTRPSSAVYEVPNVRLSAIYEVPDAITIPTSYEIPLHLQQNAAYGKATPAPTELTDNVAYTSTIADSAIQ